MKVLIINGSPNKKKSATLKITKAFLEGLGETGETVNTIDLDIKPCRGCFACWVMTNGVCVQKDDANAVLDQIRAADLVIWSVPLYCYSAPSHCKALLDRATCFNQTDMYVGGDGRTHHYGYEDGSKKTVLISSAGQADVKGNFDGLAFMFKRMFGEYTATILCAEGGLFLSPETRPLTEPYLEAARQAGSEYKATGRISEETQQKLDSLMMPREAYIRNMNGAFEALKRGEGWVWPGL